MRLAFRFLEESNTAVWLLADLSWADQASGTPASATGFGGWKARCGVGLQQSWLADPLTDQNDLA
jgi:hypothetical protein